MPNITVQDIAMPASTMPAITISYYLHFTNLELKRMLRNRHLRCSGPKAQLVARLDADDIAR